MLKFSLKLSLKRNSKV